jgi:hypothetical protein
MEEDKPMETILRLRRETPMPESETSPAAAPSPMEPSHGIEAIEVSTWFGTKQVLKDIKKKIHDATEDKEGN